MRAILVFVAVAALANLATVTALPWLINAYVMHRIVATALDAPLSPERRAQVAARGGRNVALPAARADASARTVVRPSPDLLYTACVFDVAEHPLHVTAPVQDGYVSISAFAADTSNFFAVNDGQLVAGAHGARRFDLVITRDATAPLPDGATRVIAPSARGLILFRSLVTSDADAGRLRREYQLQQACEPL